MMTRFIKPQGEQAIRQVSTAQLTDQLRSPGKHTITKLEEGELAQTLLLVRKAVPSNLIIACRDP